MSNIPPPSSSSHTTDSIWAPQTPPIDAPSDRDREVSGIATGVIASSSSTAASSSIPSPTGELQDAISSDDWGRVRLIVEKEGLSANTIVNYKGVVCSVLWAAAFSKKWAVADYISSCDPDADYNMTPCAGPHRGKTVAWLAAEFYKYLPHRIENHEFLKNILKKNLQIDVNAAPIDGEKRGISIPWMVARANEWDLFRCILENFPRTDVNAVIDYYGMNISVFDMLIDSRERELLRIIIERFPITDRVFAKCRNDYKPMLAKLIRDFPDLAELIVEKYPYADITVTFKVPDNCSYSILAEAFETGQYSLAGTMIVNHLTYHHKKSTLWDTTKLPWIHFVLEQCMDQQWRKTHCYLHYILTGKHDKPPAGVRRTGPTGYAYKSMISEDKVAEFLEYQNHIEDTLNNISDFFVGEWYDNGQDFYAIPYEIREKIACTSFYDSLPELKIIPEFVVIRLLEERAHERLLIFKDNFYKKISRLVYMTFIKKNDLLQYSGKGHAKFVCTQIREVFEKFPLQEVKMFSSEIVREIGENRKSSPLSRRSVKLAIREVISKDIPGGAASSS